MKKTIYTTVLTAILLSGCVNTQPELIADRYKKVEEVTNYDLQKVLSKMNYEEEFLGIFINDEYNINNIVNYGYRDNTFKTCKKIEGRQTSENEKQQNVNTDMFIYLSQKARVDFCSIKEIDNQQKLLTKLNLKNIYELDTYSNKEHKKEFKKWNEQNKRECSFYLDTNSKVDKVQLNDNIYIPNIKPLDIRSFYDIKVFKDKDTNKLSIKLTDKADKNYARILHESPEICELTGRSRPEFLAKNEELIKMNSFKGNQGDTKRPKGIQGCIYDIQNGNANLACFDAVKASGDASRDSAEVLNIVERIKE